ncbi:MAG: glycosyltransferase, partial [Verrucomicrobiales bacterium]
AYQAFGRTGLEAMACGCATVLTSEGGIAEYARDGENALLVDVGARGAILEAAVKVLEDDALRARLVAGGLETAPGYSMARSADSIIRLFESKVES